tara:strand:+ start:209 stop:772 length:564 start_codon:yes stop_codon:yes gene_type:complete
MPITRLNTSSLTGVIIPNTSINNASLNSVTALPSGIDTGKVVQHTTSQGGSSGNSQSTSYVATGIKHSITPTSSSNKILVLFNFNLWTQGHTGSYYWAKSTAKIVRTIGGTSADLFSGRVNGGGGAIIPAYTYGFSLSQPALNYLDAPNTTAETEYELYLAFEELQSSNGTHYWNGQKNVTLMELIP